MPPAGGGTFCAQGARRIIHSGTANSSGMARTPAAATTFRPYDQNPVPQLAILEASRVQLRGAISAVDGAHLGDDQIALAEELPDVQLIERGALAQRSAGKVDGR